MKLPMKATVFLVSFTSPPMSPGSIFHRLNSFVGIKMKKILEDNNLIKHCSYLHGSCNMFSETRCGPFIIDIDIINFPVDDLEKDHEEEDGSNLTAENLEKLNASKDCLAKSGTLTNDKLKSIMSFLDEVQVSDRLSEIDSVSLLLKF